MLIKFELLIISFNLINIETTSVCASLFVFAWILVACVKFKKFINSVKKFE
jgi:hypothetical protein